MIIFSITISTNHKQLCFKQTMGMAVMLDVVISYVQSLQNQIEVILLSLLMILLMLQETRTTD